MLTGMLRVYFLSKAWRRAQLFGALDLVLKSPGTVLLNDCQDCQCRKFCFILHGLSLTSVWNCNLCCTHAPLPSSKITINNRRITIHFLKNISKLSFFDKSVFTCFIMTYWKIYWWAIRHWYPLQVSHTLLVPNARQPYITGTSCRLAIHQWYPLQVNHTSMVHTAG